MRRTKKEEKYTMKKQKKQDVTLFSPGLMNATGEIPENLTNDVILHSVTQNNNEVLKGLTAALLMLPYGTVFVVDTQGAALPFAFLVSNLLAIKRKHSWINELVFCIILLGCLLANA